MAFMMEVSPVEDVQARLEQIKSFVILLMHEYSHEHEADSDFAVNLVTLYDLTYDVHTELTKQIYKAYMRQGSNAQAVEAGKLAEAVGDVGGDRDGV